MAETITLKLTRSEAEWLLSYVGRRPASERVSGAIYEAVGTAMWSAGWLPAATGAREGGVVSAMADMSRAIREQIERTSENGRLDGLPPDVLNDYVQIVGAFYMDLRDAQTGNLIDAMKPPAGPEGGERG